MERNNQNKLSLGFKASSNSWLLQLQQTSTEVNVRVSHFYCYFCSKMFNLSKPASKLWPFSEGKGKDFICIGIKKKRLFIPYRNPRISKLTLGITFFPPGAQDLPYYTICCKWPKHLQIYLSQDYKGESLFIRGWQLPLASPALCPGHRMLSSNQILRQPMLQSTSTITRPKPKCTPHIYAHFRHFPHKSKCTHLDTP